MIVYSARIAQRVICEGEKIIKKALVIMTSHTPGKESFNAYAQSEITVGGISCEENWRYETCPENTE